MEVGSFIGAAVVTGGELLIKQADPQHMDMVALVFEKLGVNWEVRGQDIFVPCAQQLTITPDLGGRIPIIKAQPWSLIAVNMLTGDVAYFVAGSAGTPLVFTIVLLGVQRIPSVMVGTALGAGIISNVVGQQLDIMVAVASIGTVVGLMIGFAIARKYLPGWLNRIEADKVQDDNQV